MIVEHEHPRAHLVVDDFLTPSAVSTIFRELPSLHRRMKPGLVRDIGHDGQSVFFEHRRRKNKAVWIHEPSKTLRLFRAHLWSDAMLASFDQAREPLFQIIPNCWAPHLQVSSYMTGDHYDFHEDEGAGVNLTAIVFMAVDPTKVHGGDLVLAYDGAETTIRFRHNRLVIFPSKTLHRVTRVRVDSTDTKHARVSLQCWLTYGRPPKAEAPRKKTSDETRRTTEADRPTFLLAEAAILHAAQRMSVSVAQTPEDLYWGAFYVSRVLSQNLRCLIAAQQHGLANEKVSIRRIDGGDLEVYARVKQAGGARVGFLLRGPETPSSEALSLFVETGRGRARSISRRVVPLGSGERESGAILRRLLERQLQALNSPSGV